MKTFGEFVNEKHKVGFWGKPLAEIVNSEELTYLPKHLQTFLQVLNNRIVEFGETEKTDFASFINYHYCEVDLQKQFVEIMNNEAFDVLPPAFQNFVYAIVRDLEAFCKEN